MGYLSSTISSSALKTWCPNASPVGGGLGVLPGSSSYLSLQVHEGKGVWDHWLSDLRVDIWRSSRALSWWMGLFPVVACTVKTTRHVGGFSILGRNSCVETGPVLTKYNPQEKCSDGTMWCSQKVLFLFCYHCSDSYIVRVKAVVMTRDDSSGGWLPQEGGGLSRVGVCKVTYPEGNGRSGFLIHGERQKDKLVIELNLTFVCSYNENYPKSVAIVFLCKFFLKKHKEQAYANSTRLDKAKPSSSRIAIFCCLGCHAATWKEQVNCQPPCKIPPLVIEKGPVIFFFFLRPSRGMWEVNWSVKNPWSQSHCTE